MNINIKTKINLNEVLGFAIAYTLRHYNITINEEEAIELCDEIINQEGFQDCLKNMISFEK